MQIYNVMKLAFLLIIILFKTNNIAKPNPSDSTKVTNSKNNHIFDIAFFTDYALGYQIYKASNSEIRLLLDLYINGNNIQEDIISTRFLSDTTISENKTGENQSEYYKVSFSTHYLLNLYKSSLGVAYFGIGPFIGYKWYKQKYISKEIGIESDNGFLSTNDEYFVGLTSLFGIRSNLNNSTSFFAEFQLSGGKSWGESEYSNTDYYKYNNSTEIYKSTSNLSGWFYNFTYARIGLRFAI